MSPGWPVGAGMTAAPAARSSWLVPDAEGRHVADLADGGAFRGVLGLPIRGCALWLLAAGWRR